jgi:GNAT superfamily N-acetyltransferase
MIEPEIRLARSEDTTELAVLEQQSRDHLQDQRGGVRWLEEHPPAEWTNLVARGEVTVATLDDVVLGYLVCETVHPSVALIRQVYVEPEARGIGCGDGMMAAAIEQARSTQHQFLEGEALPGDRETKNLYERAGITARLITVSTKL